MNHSARFDIAVTCLAWLCSAAIMFTALWFAGKGVQWLLS